MEKDFMLCALCKEELTETKDPRSLDCSHSFCCSCLQQHYHGSENKITCLNCQKETVIPSGGLSAIGRNPFLSLLMSKSTQLNSTREEPFNQTKADCQKYITEMKNHGIAILPSGTVLSDFRYEKKGALLYALFYRENGQEAEFNYAAGLFCKLALLFKSHEPKVNTAIKSDTTISFVAIDIDKFLSQSVNEHVNENDIVLWEYNSYRKIDLSHIEILEKVEHLAFMRYSPTISPRNLEITPPVRAKINMCCPAQGCCDRKIKWEWHCVGCMTPLDYDIQSDQISCDCGAWENLERTTSYEASCGNAAHGFIIVAHSQLKDTFLLLEKVKEINILVIGETGVGKSTWINAVANYLSSSTLEEAKADSKFQCLIKSVLERHTTSNCQPELQDAIDNKVEDQTTDWDADTRIPSSYLVPTSKKNIRLIDTPGVCNPSGKEHDKRHCEDILFFLANAQFKELHGICILLKSGTTRLTSEYQYCLTELFKQLHKSAAKNLIFCFTFSRLSQFKTNKALVVLKKMLSDIEKDIHIEIPLKEGRNVFLLDNEVFEYLCSVRNNITFDEIETADYKRSWDKSKAETSRLFEYIESLNPYHIKNSSSIYEARNLIARIIEPTLTLQQVLERNTKRMEHAAAEYEMNSSIQVDNKIYFKMEKKITEKLTSTSTQCKKCLEPPVIKPHLEQHKEETHVLEKVCQENINWFFYIIRSWLPFSWECSHCKCSGRHHRYSAYRQITVYYYDSVESIQKLKDEIDANKRNLSKISTIVAKFSFFLQKSALAKYSDIVEDQIKFEEDIFKEKKVTDSYSQEDKDRDMETLRIIKENHVEEKKRFEDMSELQADQIFELRDELYEIPGTGSDLKCLVDIDEKAKSNEMSSKEKILKRVKRVFTFLRESDSLNPANLMNQI